MPESKTVKDVLVSMSNYPHVPHWFSIRKAIHIARLSLFNVTEFPVPMAILVLDDKYNLVGTLTLEDILKELGLSSGEEVNKAAERPVSSIMTPAKFSVELKDHISKAAALMIQNNLILLPVLDDKKKFVGLVRIIEVFDEMSKDILKENGGGR